METSPADSGEWGPRTGSDQEGVRSSGRAGVGEPEAEAPGITDAPSPSTTSFTAARGDERESSSSRQEDLSAVGDVGAGAPDDRRAAAAERLAAESPVGEPVADAPAAGEPAVGEPVTGESLTGEPMVGEPMTGEPRPGEPVTGGPAVGESMTGGPMVGEPVTGDPAAGESIAGEPPVAREPAVVAPDAATARGAIDVTDRRIADMLSEPNPEGASAEVSATASSLDVSGSERASETGPGPGTPLPPHDERVKEASDSDDAEAGDLLDVSRETSPAVIGASDARLTEQTPSAWHHQNAGAGDVSTGTETRDAPRGDLSTGQTSPAEPSPPAARGSTDGSAGTDEAETVHEEPVAESSEPQEQMSDFPHSTSAGTSPLHVSYDEHERVDLVRSLPSVDESTPLAVEVAEDARRRITLSGRPFPRPPHTRVLTVANQKGGVGKTTTTVNLAAALAQAGLNVLVLDIDPQGNASTALGIDHHSDIPSLYDVVVEGMPLRDVLQVCPDVPNLWCAPATIDLAGAEIELVSLVARETRLQKALTTYLEERAQAGEPPIDYVFVDCPPSLSLLTVNAFVAAREVLIPIQCEYYALEGLSQLLKHVELIRGHLNPELHVSTILLTMYDGRTRLSSQVADEVREHFPEQVVKTTVPRSVRISEAPSHSQTVMTYDPASSGALSYLEAARELAEQVLTWNDRTTRTEERV